MAKIQKGNGEEFGYDVTNLTSFGGSLYAKLPPRLVKDFSLHPQDKIHLFIQKIKKPQFPISLPSHKKLKQNTNPHTDKRKLY